MSQPKSVKFNFVMNAILSMSSFLFPLITFPYVSRILLPIGTGKVSFATSVVSYFAMFAQLGIPTYGIRACAKVRDEKEKLSKIAKELLVINLLMTGIIYVIFLCTLMLVPKFAQEKELLLIISVTMIFNMLGAEWLYKALEQYSYITMRSIIFKVVALIFMFLFVKNQKDYIVYGAITVFASVGSGILNFINLRKHIFLNGKLTLGLRQHIKPIIIFFSMTIATTIYTNLDTVMLGFMQGDEAVGYYNAAVKIKNILVSLVTSLGTVLLPRVSYYIEKKMEKEFQKITAKAFNFVVLVAVPLSIYFILFAEDSIIFLSGTAYMGAIAPMKIIMPTVFLIGLSNIMGIQMLIPLGQEKMVLWSEIAGAIVNLALNTTLIPRYASIGAAIGTLVAELVVVLVQLWALRKTIIPIISELKVVKIIIALLLSTLVIVILKQWHLSSYFLQLGWTAFVYFGVYGSVLLCMKEPLVFNIMDEVLRKLHLKK